MAQEAPPPLVEPEPQLTESAPPLPASPGAAEQRVQSAQLFPAAPEEAAPDLTLDAPQRWRFVLEGKVRVVYDDNISTQPSDKQSDVVLAIAPRASLEIGDFRDRKENFLLLTYAPTAFFFLQGNAENTVDHDVLFETQAAFSKLLLSATLRFESLSDSEIDTGNRTTRQIYSAAFGMRWALSGKSSADLDLHYTAYEYEMRIDSQEAVARLWLNYDFSPKIVAGLGVGFGWLKPDGSDDQTFEQPAVRAVWDPTEKLSIRGEIGVDIRQLSSGDRITPVGMIGVRWAPFDGTTISADFSSRVRASAALGGRNFTATTAVLKLRQRFFQKLFANLRIGYTHADYYATRFDQPSDREDDYFFIRPSLEFVAAERWRVEAFYQYRTNDSNLDPYSFDNNQVGLEFSIAF